jgi:hypothetical protein
MARVSAPKEVIGLVERFDRNRDSYLAGGINETQLRQEFRQGPPLLKSHKNLPKARTAPDKTAIERQIAATDEQVDQLAYALYGLTEEKTRDVEGNRK